MENVWSAVMRVSPELGLAYLRAEDEETLFAILRAATQIAREKLEAGEFGHSAELEQALAVLAHAIEE